ncbi:DUF7452 domain-containing protein [Sorangium atrum]|uniref:DUF7452 domain-containing protein n=1 Tax=Sorangium atrum TaxID=2995308 RepID=A0ABT5CGE5_9BACT|nr:hypothetical protein [Sorangium aterium]MDC0684895.1 hypothetical protein [Sorangium aterium]
MKLKRLESARGALAVLLAGGLLAGCSTTEPQPQEAPPGVSQAALAPEPTSPGGVDAGNAAWVEQVVPALLGRPVRSFGELKFLTVMTARVGRARMAEALMSHPAFVDRWTGVLLDRMRVDREGSRSQSDCFSQPLLSSDNDKIRAAKVVLYTRRLGNALSLSEAVAEPPVSASPGTYNMADVVRGSLLMDNVFPAYRGFVFALVRQYGSDDAKTHEKQRQIADHFTQVYANKSMECLKCHRTHFSSVSSSSASLFTPGYDWAKGQEGRVFSGLSAWATAGSFQAPTDADWVGSFRQSPGTNVPFAGWDGASCGSFSNDTSTQTPGGTGLLLPDASSTTVWALDDRLKEGFLALRKSYDSGDLDTGANHANQGRTLGAFWLAAAFANDVWREFFGAPLTISNFTSRNTHEHKLLWNLAENHVVGRGWSLKGLLTEIVTSPYFNRLAESSATMPKVFEPFIDTPAQDYVGDAVHRRSADLLFRMKASALQWKAGGKLWVTHFPQSTTYPTPSQAEAMGLHLSRLSAANPTSSQYSMLGWEASAGRCDRPAAISRDWIDALADRAMTGGVTVRGAVEALRFRLLGRGLSAGSGEATALSTFLGKSMTATFASAYTTAGLGNAALRDLCEVFVKTPQFMLEGVPHGVGVSETDFDSPPQLQVGDMKNDGTLAADTPSAACESWVDPQTAFDGISVNCADESFPQNIDWSKICPSGGCVYREAVLPDLPRPWPCLGCSFDSDWFTTLPPPVDPRVVTDLPMPMTPARGGVFLAWAEGATIVQVSGQARFVHAHGQSTPAAPGMVLQLGDSLELWAGDKFKVVAPSGQVFENPTGGMPPNQSAQTYLFMATGPNGLPDPTEMTPTTVDMNTASTVKEAMRQAARNEEAGSVSLFHDVTSTTGNMSHINHPALNGKPDLILLVSPVAGAVSNDHHVGVWYDTALQRWAVYNEDLAAMPLGVRFSVRAMPPSGSVFIHEVTAANKPAGSISTIDHPALNGRSSIAVQVSRIWNLPGAPGVYNNHPVGVSYDTSVQKWTVYNEDQGTLSPGALFAVKLGGDFKVTSSPATRVGTALVIDEPNINGVADARLFFTHGFSGTGTLHTKRSALRYDTTLQKWTIINRDGTTVANNLVFHVHRGY